MFRWLPPWLPRAVFEAALIVFAVVLGFVVNEWREDVAEQRDSRIALVRIAEEMESNLARLEEVIPYHQEVVVELEAINASLASGELRNQGVLLEVMRPAFPRGAEPPVLARAAWESASSRGELDALDFELVADIARIYRMQEFGIQTTWQRIVETIFYTEGALSERELTGAIRYTSLMMQEALSQEVFLQARYEEVLALVGEELGETGQ